MIDKEYEKIINKYKNGSIKNKIICKLMVWSAKIAVWVEVNFILLKYKIFGINDFPKFWKKMERIEKELKEQNND